MPQKLNMQRSSSSLPHHLQLLILLILSSSCYIDIAFAFTSSPTIISSRQTNKFTSSSTNNVINPRIHHSTTLHYSSNSNDDNNNNNSSKTQQQRVQVAGVSVSPIGFLVILQSIMNDANNQKMEVAFPIQLTSSGTTNDNNNNSDGTTSSSSNNNLTIPSLFQENNDQSSVTTPEALTFLQLLNGVDMATPILPPDTLSSVCVWYAFLLEEKLLEEQMNVVEEGMGEGGLLYEDELGLETLPLQSSQPKEEGNEQEKAHHEKYSSALNYIRAMVRTTLPPSKDGSYFVNYIDASNWQRARVQLPRVWLHGVKMEMMDLALFHHNNEEEDGGTSSVGRVPIKYTLQCSVDDGLKRLEIPLFAIPSSYQLTSSSSHLEQQLEISNEILQELSHNYNTETSASFLSLALYYRYNTSGSGEAGSATTDSPTLKVDEELLNQLLKMQQTMKSMQYCWPTSIRSIIQANGLPMYRPLHQIKEEDQRVLERIYGEGGSGNNGGGMEEEDASTMMSDKSKKEPKKKALTLEQQALQQRLKSAWKIATQKGDSGALEKIQKAMEDLEKELIIEEEVEEDTSTLDRIQRAMRERDEVRDDEEEEEVVGLVSDLEEAIRMEGRSEVDDREEEL
eukprot:scaffold16024_cov81-Skeletonema_dohrnii-CCMP3373.AAC.1